MLTEMASTAKKLQTTATSSGAALLETKLNDNTRLHGFLLEEMATHYELLVQKIEKWDSLNARMEDLATWMDNTEGKLELITGSEKFDGHCLSDIKVGCLKFNCL